MALEDFIGGYNGTIEDQTSQFLEAYGSTPGPLPDMWMQFFTDRGYSQGTLLDKMRQFLIDYTGSADTGQTIQDLWSLVTEPYAGGPFLADTYSTGLYGAYSTRKLAETATSPFSMENFSFVTTDATFSGGNLNTQGVLDYAAANGDFAGVEVWYNQLGPGADIIQVVIDNQPNIVDGGVLMTAPNGRPALRCTDTGEFMEFDTAGANVALTSIFLAGRTSSLTTAARNFMLRASAATGTGLAFDGTAVNGITLCNSTTTLITEGAGDTDMHIVSLISSGGTMSMHVDNVLIGTTALATFDMRWLFLSFQGFIGELLAYTTDKTADRAAITANMASYWGVTI